MELKPCPFCGCALVGKEEIWRHKVTNITGKYTVYTHPQKGCILDFSRFHFYNDQKQIEAWNRRADNTRWGIADDKNSVDSTRKGVEEG